MAIKIIWDLEAKQSLNDIYKYHLKFSEQGAKKVRTAILQAPYKIHYPKQFQVDEYNIKYRRIIVRGDYKLLYSDNGNTIRILDVVGTKQLPKA